jgi:hypothetical protein
MEVFETVIGLGIPGRLNNELKVPEAVTDTVTTQCCPEAHVGGLAGKQAALVSGLTVPPLSHPQVTVDVTVRVLVCPLFT